MAKPLTVVPLGDLTVAMRLTASETVSGQPITVNLDIVVIRHHDTLIVVEVVSISPDTTMTESIASAAYGKVVSRS